MQTLLSGSTIGILGGGQLARMTALKAAQLGFRVHVFCASADEPAVSVCAKHTLASFEDEAALKAFAKSVDVVTLEWENVPLKALDIIAQTTPVFPAASVLRVTQDRGLEKRFTREAGLGTAPFAIVTSAEELQKAADAIRLPAILKTTRMGYDGRGQIKIERKEDLTQAWDKLAAPQAILEGFVPFEKEIAVIVCRRADGAMALYPPVHTVQRNHILAEAYVPAGLTDEVEQEALAMAAQLATHFHLVGLLVVEMFVLEKPDAQGRHVLMNEMAPRPHNAGHWSLDACACSQFEMLVRAIAGLPLGSTVPHSRARMLNILGQDLGKSIGWLSDPKACLHLYGKKEPRNNRKMGHVTFLEGPWVEAL
ncbi:MAG: 5-(carboxyamino)imidazole ribonucleotide synthase [Alphaproteobacteria bacterium]|nr:5-(carboxyamino)imidazole ribonucleotide synthase [Alphaproteobacteria bacterium]